MINDQARIVHKMWKIRKLRAITIGAFWLLIGVSCGMGLAWLTGISMMGLLISIPCGFYGGLRASEVWMGWEE